MDKRKAHSWYIGGTHALTAYFTAGVFAFLVVFMCSIIAVMFGLDIETVKVYTAVGTSLVAIPLLMFPATMYSVHFIMNRYIINDKRWIIIHALAAIFAFELAVDVVWLSSFTTSNILGFILSIVVFYYVSKEAIQMDNGMSDSIQLKDVNMHYEE